MLAIRILTGPQAGQIFNLTAGAHRLGRSPSCEFQLNLPGVSKEHFEITLEGKNVHIKDLQSSNGTFVNGVKINSTSLKPGDKISAFNILMELVPVEEKRLVVNPSIHQPVVPQANAAAMTPAAPQTKSNDYIDRVMLPGVYNLTEVFELKYILMSFVGLYVLVVTLLSMIPMKQITSESIANESRRRALTVARALAQANEKIIRQGDIANFRSDLVLREEGIEDVYIISKDGTILAPPERAGMQPKEAGLVKASRGQTREISQEVGTSIAAAVPINIFDPELQQNAPKAHAVVIYNPGALSFDDGRALGLFIQMLALALLIGFILYFFLYKLVEYPLVRLNQQLDIALREGREHAEVNMQFPVLQHVLTNVNSLLARAQNFNHQQSAPLAGAVSKDPEMLNLLNLIGYSALIIKKDKRILGVNATFERDIAIPTYVLQGQKLQDLPDQALQKNIQHLITLAETQPAITHTDHLNYMGRSYLVHCQAFSNISGEQEYFIITMIEEVQSEGGAA